MHQLHERHIHLFKKKARRSRFENFLTITKNETVFEHRQMLFFCNTNQIFKFHNNNRKNKNEFNQNKNHRELINFEKFQKCTSFF